MAMSTRRLGSSTMTEIRSEGFDLATMQQKRNDAAAKRMRGLLELARMDQSLGLRLLRARHRVRDRCRGAGDWLRHRQGPAPWRDRTSGSARDDKKRWPDGRASSRCELRRSANEYPRRGGCERNR